MGVCSDAAETNTYMTTFSASKSFETILAVGDRIGGDDFRFSHHLFIFLLAPFLSNGNQRDIFF
jgi:hypothetical protein